MTTFDKFSGRTRDQQDGFERMVFESQEHTAAGWIMKAKGTGTEDVEMPVINAGIGMNLPRGTNAEALAIALGSDTNQKYVLPTIPRDKQRSWQEGSGGVQNPMDPEKALEFNSKRAHITDPNVAFGPDGAFEIKDGKLYIRIPVVIETTATVNGQVITPVVNPGREDIPAFEK